MEWTKYFTFTIWKYEEYTSNIFKDSHIFLEMALQAQIRANLEDGIWNSIKFKWND
jgi:hypothetical protein